MNAKQTEGWLKDGWEALDADVQKALRESSGSIAGGKETLDRLWRMGICRTPVGPDAGGWHAASLHEVGNKLAEYGRSLNDEQSPEDHAAASERRRCLLLSCLPALKLFRDDLVADGLLHKLPGLERIIGEVEAEVG